MNFYLRVCILLISLQTFQSIGQDYFNWSFSFGANPGIAYDIIQTMDGGYAVTGYIYNDTTEEDVIIYKLDALGAIEWQVTYGGAKRDIGRAILEDTTGNIFITGYGNSFNDGDYDLIYMKLDPDGNVLWKKILQGDGDDHGWHLTLDKDSSSVLITGYTVSFGPGIGSNMILKINQDGDTLSTRTYGGPVRELGHFIQSVASGYLVCGHGTSYSATGDEEVYLFKVDNDFNPQWGRSYGSLGREEGNAIGVFSTGEMVIAGVTSDPVGGRDGEAHGKDILLIKINTFGDTIWSKRLGSIDDDDVLDAVVNESDEIIVTGITTGFTDDRDIIYIKLDSDGNIITARVIDGMEREAAYGICNTNDGGFAIYGYTTSFGLTSEQFVTKHDSEATLNCNEIDITPFNINVAPRMATGLMVEQPDWNWFEAPGTALPGELISNLKCGLTGLSEETTTFDALVYPNPSTGMLTIELPNDLTEAVTYRIFDIRGQLILDGSINGDDHQTQIVDLSHFEDGIYLIVLRTSTGQRAILKTTLLR
ncbi:MAG: hypothetical protein ACI8ZM_001619 [Crocinitomix sp.]|jgi:hypothetical protein